MLIGKRLTKLFAFSVSLILKNYQIQHQIIQKLENTDLQDWDLPRKRGNQESTNIESCVYSSFKTETQLHSFCSNVILL